METGALIRELVRQVTLREDSAPPPLVDAMEWLVSYIESRGEAGTEFPQDWAARVRDYVDVRHR